MTTGAATTPYHVMIDIETLGTGNKAVIWALGASRFSLEQGNSSETRNFYITIDPQSCVAAGLELDVNTVMWWMSEKQAEARKQLIECGPGLDIASALDGFARWLPPKENLHGVWGNGATFDNVIVRSAYTALGLQCPWSYKVDSCFRTIKNLHPHVAWDEGTGTAHNALDDAISQTRHLRKMLGVN